MLDAVGFAIIYKSVWKWGTRSLESIPLLHVILHAVSTVRMERSKWGLM